MLPAAEVLFSRVSLYHPEIIILLSFQQYDDDIEGIRVAIQKLTASRKHRNFPLLCLMLLFLANPTEIRTIQTFSLQEYSYHFLLITCYRFGGSRGRAPGTPPYGTQLFRFRIHCNQKAPMSEVDTLQWVDAPPNGKSWIRHCTDNNCYNLG